MNVSLVGISPCALNLCRPHMHSTWEIVLNLVGEGSSLVGDTEYAFHPGTILCQPPGLSHSKKSDGSFTDIFLQTDTLTLPTHDSVAVFNDDEGKSFETLMYLALRVFHKKDPNYAAVLHSISETMNQLLLGWCDAGQKNETVELFKNELIENFTNPEFLLSEAMKKTSYCDDHFRRQFKKDVGMTPSTYLNHLRIEYAKKLLSRQSAAGRSIGEISLSSGFFDQHYFSRIFKAKTGRTPLEYINYKMRVSETISGTDACGCGDVSGCGSSSYNPAGNNPAGDNPAGNNPARDANVADCSGSLNYLCGIIP